MEPIDIDKVLAAKIPKIYPFIPHMLVERLRKLIHEQEMNHIITQFGNQPQWNSFAPASDTWE